MSSRGILALVLMALAVGTERFAYYGTRVFLSHDLMEAGRPVSSLGAVFAGITWGGLLATFLGAGLSYAIGPRITAAIGVLVATLGYFVLAFTQSLFPWLFIAAGAGIFRVCPYIVAAELLGSEPPGIDGARTNIPSPRRFAAVSAFAIGAYALIHIGSGLSSALTSFLRQSFGRTPSLILTASSGLFAVLLVGGVVILGLPERRVLVPAANDPYRAPAPAPSSVGPIGAPSSPSGQALTGLAILAIGGGIFMLGTSLSSPPITGRVADMAWLFSLNPAVVALGGIVLFIVFLVATMGRWSMTPLLVFAIGLIVAGLGFFITAASSASGSIAIYALGAVIVGAAETVVPIATAYAALAVRGRGAALVLAVWMAALTVIANGSSIVGFSGARTAMLVLVGLAALVCGVAFAIKARRLQAFFDLPPA